MQKHPRIRSSIPHECVIGIDEAGRGPLAGPVAVGAVRLPLKFKKNFFRGIKDSKQLSADERELWFSLAVEARKRGELDFAVSLISNTVIDKKGITRAVKQGIKRCLSRLEVPAKTSHIFLDGLLHAPSEFPHQLTIIKGDEKVPVISLASILAKVTRDRHMKRMAKRFPDYLFEKHKGYGTRDHLDALRTFGLSVIHRKTFLKNIS